MVAAAPNSASSGWLITTSAFQRSDQLVALKRAHRLVYRTAFARLTTRSRVRLPSSMTSDAQEAHFRHSYTKDRRALITRLRKIEGQSRGIQRLVEEEAYCLDVLQQVEALTARRRPGRAPAVGPYRRLPDPRDRDRPGAAVDEVHWSCDGRWAGARGPAERLTGSGRGRGFGSAGERPLPIAGLRLAHRADKRPLVAQVTPEHRRAARRALGRRVESEDRLEPFQPGALARDQRVEVLPLRMCQF